MRLGRFSAIWVATAILLGVSPFIASGSLSQAAIFSMLPFAAILALVAVGQTLVVQQRGLDLSIPGAISLCALLVTKFPNQSDALVPVAIALTLFGGAVVGLVNGLTVALFGVAPFVATLGVNALLLGFVQWYSGGSPTGAAGALNQWALATTAGLPNTVVLTVVLIAIAQAMLLLTVSGRRFEAVGDNPDAALAAGIRVLRYQVGSYVLAGVCYAIAAILLAAFLKTPGVFIGDTYLLPSVAAVVLGGTALTGGVGNVGASAIAALFLTQLGQLVLSIGAPTAVQLLIQSGAIAVGMGLREMNQSFLLRWLRPG
ncbi:ribose transport system permease protein [Roseiarcus fermentans]|uniref:Ribose transport system permease protein n=1 Tax=Roseiarcus fermentans TaxID=1473586 RepID=A0A366EY41_9HYPH|nr:ABC transporter permease [Roseiarcus fermentans]RBP07313.1 ribose transport system permease protein [Roseiarcus fermentans]